jgi:WD40 repeat protein
MLTLRGHTGAVLSVAIDIKRIASGGADGTARTWLMETGEAEWTVRGDNDSRRVRRVHSGCVHLKRTSLYR